HADRSPRLPMQDGGRLGSVQRPGTCCSPRAGRMCRGRIEPAGLRAPCAGSSRQGVRFMREVFQQELREVQDRLVETAQLVADSIEQATRAFNGSDVSLAGEVVADDDRIDRLTVALDELAITILARQQPVARDLRIVVSALRISASLERMGHMAEHIAQLARYRFPEKVVPKGLRSTFREMGALDVEIARNLTELLRTQDTDIAEHIRNEDDKVDALHLAVFDKVLGETWKGETVDTVDATLASRYHERFADHAVSIAKKVQYPATGPEPAPSDLSWRGWSRDSPAGETPPAARSFSPPRHPRRWPYAGTVTPQPADIASAYRDAEARLLAEYGLARADDRMVEVPGTGMRLHVIELAGDERVPVVLLHGMAAVTAAAVPLIPALGGRRVIAPDWPGHGLS